MLAASFSLWSSQMSRPLSSHTSRRGGLWIALAVTLPLGLVLGTNAVLGSAGLIDPNAAASAPAPSLIDCGPGVPLVKCNASLYSPDPALTFVPETEVLPTAAPPETASCDPNFFDDEQLAKLTDWFGSIQCFRFIGSDSWIVVGDGMSLTAVVEAATPGGAVVAVLACDAADKACLDPDADHDFGAFGVSYPPDPSSGRSQVQFIESGRFVMIFNGGCGLFAFDSTSMRWYQPDVSIREDILAGKADIPQVKVPAEVSGSDALAQKAPDPTNDCQPIVP